MPLLYFFRSTIGLKIIMAGSGLLLFGFVMVHMLGNLQIFIGPEQLNAYGHLLKAEPLLLWAFRLGLLACVGLHIWAGITLGLRNRAARPVGYVTDTAKKASWASRSMVASGSIVLFFITFHILHFTVGSIDPRYMTFEDPTSHYHDIYRMVVTGFSNPWIAWGYVIGVGLLATHLSHGISSTFRSLGTTNSSWRPAQLWFGRLFALIIFLGMSMIPLAVQFHVLTLAPAAPLAYAHAS